MSPELATVIVSAIVAVTVALMKFVPKKTPADPLSARLTIMQAQLDDIAKTLERLSPIYDVVAKATPTERPLLFREIEKHFTELAAIIRAEDKLDDLT